LLTTLEVAGLHNECALRACCRRGSWTAYGRARCI
jgi:hypothetical protein